MNNNIYIKRSAILLTSFFILFVVLWWRVKVRTIDEGPKLSVWADSQYTDKVNVSELNYMLFDRNGKQLLEYKNKYFAIIDAAAFTKNNMNTKTDNLYALIYILRNYNNKYDLSNIGLTNTTGKIKYEIDENTYNKLKNITGVKGFYTYAYSTVDRSQAWKVENLLTSTTKPSDSTVQKDKDTIEMQIFNKTNLNQYPAIRFDKDIEGNIASGQFITPNNNVNVRLTIDKNIENKVKEVLNSDKYKKYNQIGAVLMESNTGRILTLSQKNDSLPNVNLGSSTQNGFEPGSIFKIIVEEAGLDRKSLSLVEKYPCKQSIYSGAYDKCKDKDHGVINAEDALVVSCNNIFAQIGDKVGVNNFIDNAQSQGLFSKVLNFDSEVKGTYIRPELGEGAGQLAIGQSMSITPIQAVSIVNTIVNDGTYVKPYIIDAYVDNENKELETLKAVQHPSINKSTANIMKNELEKVVRYGTGTAARIDYIEIGGKTGTSTRYDGKEYTSDGWFVGFFKLKNKYYSMVVYVQNIDKEDEEAANTAAPVFKDLVQSLSAYLQKNN